MAALTADDVTVEISQRDVEDRPGFLRHVIADLTFGDGTSTYPSGGIPLPAKEQFGFKRQISIGLVEQPPSARAMYEWRFDRDNHTLIACGASEFSTITAATKFFEVASTMAPTSTTVRVIFFGE
jgi:hypothetical protein